MTTSMRAATGFAFAVLLVGGSPLVGDAPAAGASPRTVSGVVRLVDGSPVAHVKVYVFLWGGSSQGTASTRRGSTFANPLVASTTTDSSGRYAVSVNARNRAVFAQAQRSDGYVNLQVDAEGAGRSGSVAVVRHLNRATGALETEAQAAGMTDAGAAATQTNIGLARTRVTTRPNCSPPDAATSSATLVKGPWRRGTTLTAVHSSVDMSATYGYGTTEDSSIEVGVSFQSDTGFSAGGTAHLGRHSGVYAAQSLLSNRDRRVYGHFMYGEYKVKQWIGCTYRWQYQLRAIRWDYDVLVGRGASLNHEGCRGTRYKTGAFHRNSWWVKNGGTNQQYSADVTLPAMKLSGHHGYSSYSDIRFTFGIAGGTTYHNFQLCAVSKPVGKAAVVYNTSWK